MIGMTKSRQSEYGRVESHPSQKWETNKKAIAFECQENTIHAHRDIYPYMGCVCVCVRACIVNGDAVHVTGDLHVTFQSKAIRIGPEFGGISFAALCLSNHPVWV